jgi:hypothetical protein
MITNKNYLLQHKFSFLIITMCLGVFLMNLPLHGQSPKTWEWVRHLGGPGWDITGGAVVDAKNNIYVAGFFPDTLRYNKKKHASKGNTDLFIARFNEKGSLNDIWTMGGKHDDRATCIALSSNGDILFGGSVTDTVSFDRLTVTGKGKTLFIASMNVKGKFAWITQLKPSRQASINYLCTDSNDNIYACGQFTDTLTAAGKTLISKGKTDVFIVKLNASGTIENTLSFGSEGDDLPCAFSVSDSVIICAGNYSKPFVLGDIQVALFDKKKANSFIISLNNTLKPIWQTTLNSAEYCHISALKIADDSSLYVAGSFSNTLNMADTLIQSNGLTDGFLAKLSLSGKKRWAWNIGSSFYDYVNHLNVDHFGGAIITGSIGDTILIDSLSIEPTSNRNTAFVAQFDENGKAIWGDDISGAGRNFGETTLLDKKGNLYIYGSFTDKFQKNEEDITSFGDQDIFLARYYNCPDSKAEVLGDLQFCPGAGTELKVKSEYKNVVWNNVLKNRFFYTENPGHYWVNMYDKKGCLYSDTVEVTIAALPFFTLGKDTLLLVTDSLILSAPATYTNYRWHNRSYNPTYLVTATDNKPGRENCWLTVTDSLGCNYTDTIIITFTEPEDITAHGKIKLNTWPNPVSDLLNWSVDVDKPCRLAMDITDENGKVLHKKIIESYLPKQVKRIDVSKLPQGTFYIRLSDTNGTVIKTQGFVKQ